MGTAEIILAAVQLGRLANDLVRQYQDGDLTDEQVAERWAALIKRVQRADDAWVAAAPPAPM